MAVLNLPEPNDKQKLFLAEQHKHIGFGGARGGGKSWSVRAKAVLLSLNYPGIRSLIVRRTYPELINNHINQLRLQLIKIARYNDKDKVLRFINGSTINFMYCARDQDLDHLQGVEYDVIFFDEATQLTEYQMLTIAACLRGVNDFPKRIYYTCNPGGQGHGYIKRIFIDKKYLSGEKPGDYSFIQSLVTDNKALMESQPDYVHQLEALPAKLRDAWLYGRWDVFEGQVFEEFMDVPEHYDDRIGTHVISPFQIPEQWRIYRGFDWGYTRPYSIGWYAVDHDNRLYRIREYYGCMTDSRNREPIANMGTKEATAEIARHIRDIEDTDTNLKGKYITGIADPAIFDESKGESIAAELERNGVYFERADHKRIPGKMQCHFRLSMDENDIPMFYVFSNCKNFIRTIPLLIYDEKKVEDVDTSMEDHIYDEWRYVCMENPINPKQTAEILDAIPQDDPLDLHKDKLNQKYNKYNFMKL